MKVYLLPNASKPGALQLASRVAEILADVHVESLMDESFQGLGPHIRFSATEKLEEQCDLILTIGGDGTMLHAARRAMAAQKPLIGVNIGRLGFLTIVESDELEKLTRLATGDYTVEHRSVLAMDFGEGTETFLAMNDIIFFKSSPHKTITLDILCNNTLVSSFRGDGVVFATPTGSTAYSMSAGGPIVDAKLDCIVTTQICAHIVQTPPMVFAACRTLHVLSRGSDEEPVYTSYDGLKSTKMPKGAMARIRLAEQRVPMIQFSDAGQLHSIDKKLKGRGDGR